MSNVNLRRSPSTRRRSLPRVIVEENSSSVDRFATTTTATDEASEDASEAAADSSSSFDDREGVRAQLPHVSISSGK